MATSNGQGPAANSSDAADTSTHTNTSTSTSTDAGTRTGTGTGTNTPLALADQASSYRVSSPTKEAWISHSLKKRRGEFVSQQQLRMFVGTWNVNGRGPATAAEMRAWLGFSSADADAPDLVVAGFQELDARAEAFVYNDAAKEQQWTEALVQALPGGYRKVAARQLIGMFIVVFVAERCYDSVGGVQTASVGCGIMGVVGNKGAVGVRLVYGDTPVCFVCAHLAHDAAQVERRNAQFHEVCRRLVFAPDDAGWPDPLAPRREPAGAVGVFDHAYVVWLGDLNYRVGQSEPSEPGGPGQADPGPSTYAELLALDQLRAAMGDRQAFAGFEEAAVRFAPTYKFVPGTARYDERRRPAWCDRVLWWAPSGGIGCDEYTAAASVLMSDHRPVRARLVADVWRVGRARRQAVYLDVLRELDRYENECIPTASLDADRVDFGRVVFGSRVARRLRLANTGQVPLEYGFVATPAYARGMPAWLRIAPGSGMLLPGEAAHLELSVLVDERSSAALTTLSEDLAAILVLHLTRGRDYFLQVAGCYEPSVFGCPLEILVHLRGPIRAMQRADFAACLASGQFSVPRCVWALTDFIARYGVERGCSCFERPPDRALMRVVREWLDEDQALDPAVLLQWRAEAEAEADADSHVARTVVEGRSPQLRLEPAMRRFSERTAVGSAIPMLANGGAASEALERMTLDTASYGSGSGSESESDAEPPTASVAAAAAAVGNGGSGSSSSSTVAVSALPHDIGIDTACGCLVDLFRSLPEPLVPFDMYAACVEAGGVSRAAALEALEILAPGRLNVLVYLLAFLRECVERGAVTRRRVARVFAQVILRPRDVEDAVVGEGAERFVEFLLIAQGQI
ncbi:hypothetical protein LPJ66_009105 [Kickxella alabastrina]|uniref:Uncharacterized protein n=1 Tax=Kickxella alabastrina TaxID=61397 RepID=A0ACC1I6P7_9FUNG|nr:hypothetical protein LPJ66_009105 [Kickxella alabastrina]